MSKNTVRTGLTRKRAKRPVEDGAYGAFVVRILAAYGRRVAHGDVEDLRLMASLGSYVDTVVRTAVTGLREAGFTWSQIADRLGITKQSAQERYGNPVDRNALDPRLLTAGLGVSVTVLVDVFADHHPGIPTASRCPACHYLYPEGVTDCPTNATVRPILFGRRHEDWKALERLTPDQRADLFDKKTARANRRNANQAAQSMVDGQPEPLFALSSTGGGHR